MNLAVMSRAALLAAPRSSPIGSVKVPRTQVLHPAASRSSAGWSSNNRKERCVALRAAAADDASNLDPVERAAAAIVGEKNAPNFVTLGFILLWYGLNVGFNLTNKSLFNVFPFPWFVSTVHVVVGTVYCAITYLLGARDASFQRPITSKEFKAIFGPAAMHAVGHVAANLSFAAVAISLTHTVKTLEPAFNVLLSQLILGQSTPAPVMLSLVPIMVGVSLASAAELSFNWFGFLTAMGSNLTFGFRAVWAKKAMSEFEKPLSSTAVYAYTTLISVFICAPGVLFFEGAKLASGIDNAVAIMGTQALVIQLLTVGLLYHLYNQFAFNTLARVSPVSHGVCNVVKRIFIIGSSVLFFGNKLSTNTMIGTTIAIFGTWLYTQATAKAHAAKAH